MNSAAVNGLNISHQFQYDSSAELTQVTTPLGGVLKWAYQNDYYTGSGRSYRAVQYRYLQAVSGGTTYQWNVQMDAAVVWHGVTTLQDVGASTQKVWNFSTNGSSFPGLATAYEEHDTTGVLLHKGYTWTCDISQAFGRPYVRTAVTKLNYNAGSEADTTTVQTLDTHGNLTQSQVYDYGSSSPTRTYNYTYLTDTNYTSRFIYNRMTSASVTPAGGSAITLVTNTYDNEGMGLQTNASTVMHDANYGTNYIYRGNVTQTTGLNSGDMTYFYHDTAGLLVQTTNASGSTVTLSTDQTTNYSLPTTVTPNSNGSLNTSMTYASSFAVASLTGPNNAQQTTSYDAYGRPSQTTIPDGAATTYTYNYNPTYQVATLDGRWKKTTLDGFGRTIQMDMGTGTVSDANTVSRVLTQYAPCACSPLLKVKQVSEPFNPNGGSPVWTVYTYDGSGRAIQVLKPDGASKTTTAYAGNSVTITDAAAKWKTQTKDAFGNLILVTEPNPAGGANWTTSYSYNALNQLTTVSMTRPTGTQTRTFAYTGADMTSATNPENGTVTYTYSATHQVLSRTDAKGQVTQYTYDSYGRVTKVQYFPTPGNEDVSQQVVYTYDQGANGQGRLSSVQFGRNDNPTGPFTYSYSYNQAGRVTSQSMTLGMVPYLTNYYPPYQVSTTMTATYQWDTEGRMTQIGYPAYIPPGWCCGNPPVGPLYALQYDSMGRLISTTEDLGWGPQPAASAQYGPAGELLNLSYFGINEKRAYNSLLQVIHMTATPQYGPSVMDMQYNYSATLNNGRIVSSNDYVTGENVSYTYDALNRLTVASAGSMWGETYTYDGFGNLTGKSQAPPPAPGLGVSYDANNHQVGLQYDANGNQTWDAQGATAYGWNVENRLVTETSQAWPGPETWYAYDPWGKRVMKDVNPDPNGMEGGTGYWDGAWEFYFYGITGQKLMTLDCNYADNGDGGYHYANGPTCTTVGYNLYFGSKLVQSNGAPVVTDRLGSVRYSAGVSRSYFPYGEERTSTPEGTEKFGTYFSDAPGQDYAEQRYYNAGMGRFWSPDNGRARLGKPTSWNRYAYVNGDPVNRYDPHGREEVAPVDGCVVSGVDDNGNPIYNCGQTFEGGTTQTSGDDGGDGGDDGGGGGVGGDPEPPDPSPVSDPDQPTKKPTKTYPCTQGQRNFVSSHLADATAAAGLIGTNALDLLALSGYESGWGTGPFMAAQGNYTGNAFFNLEGEIATPTSTLPSTLYDSTGWSQPSSQKNADGMYAIVAGYANYYDAAMSFVNYKGGLFANVTDPTAFGKIAASNGFGINVSTFVSIASTLATCLH